MRTAEAFVSWPSRLLRSTLHATPSGVAEDLWKPSGQDVSSGYSPEAQLVFPYLGACDWTVGGSTRLVDANHILFVRARQTYSERHPIAGMGHASLVVTPRADLLEEVFGGRTAVDQTFGAVSRPCGPTVRKAVQGIRGRLDAPANPQLESEELLVGLLRDAASTTARMPRSKPSRPVERAKQFLHAHATDRFSLTQVANAVGVSGAYLTSLFSAFEGMSLCRYQLGLRLARAVVELPRCDDITRLALELSFSSHSHFCSAFRAAFQMSPSTFRAARRISVTLQRDTDAAIRGSPAVAADLGSPSIVAASRRLPYDTHS